MALNPSHEGTDSNQLKQSMELQGQSFSVPLATQTRAQESPDEQRLNTVGDEFIDVRDEPPQGDRSNRLSDRDVLVSLDHLVSN
jgi:hypothetical protein